MTYRQPLRTFQVLAHHPAVRALLAAAGETPCHLVGGALRDRLLGLPSHDIDVAVSGRGREIGASAAEALGARLVMLGGKEFAAYRLVGTDFVLDLWDRGESSLRDDLARRDFTVNAIAFDPRAGLVFDPFGGIADLERRALRATTPRSFVDDPLRVLRLPRLVLQLPGFAAGPNTLGLARAAAPRLVEVAAERVREELGLIFGHAEAHRGLALLAVLDLYPGLWLGQPGEHGGSAVAGRAVHEIEALAEAVQVLRELAPRLADSVRNTSARLASTFASLVAPRPASEALPHLARFRDAGYLTRTAADEVARLLPPTDLPADALGRRRFLHRTGALWPTTACHLGARAIARGEGILWRERLRPLADLALREGEAILDPPRLLTGGEVQDLLEIPPGPRIGEALTVLREAQVDGKVRTREEALALVKGLHLPQTGPELA
jgi:tRNA nucleotidyltransferase/poly(A) polymerase